MRRDQHQEQGAFLARSAFRRRPDAVKVARSWAATVVQQVAGGTEAQALTCELLVSELATNAVLHAQGALFEVTVWPECVVDVRDGSREKPESRVSEDDDENGRGLTLVTALSEKFEVIPTADGKIVRFQLAQE
ncbi:ATP-binding protein [Streptomyces sp. Midd1]|uniref:ATP-binding protein n=1 Tax=Streptomyces sp. Midd3 TaxID=3161191 RepID=UPI0034DB3136